jgi:hypothetical protein
MYRIASYSVLLGQKKNKHLNPLNNSTIAQRERQNQLQNKRPLERVLVDEEPKKQHKYQRD